MFYLDNVFPLRMNMFDIRQLFFRNTKRYIDSRANKAIPPTEKLGHEFTVKHMEARYVEGHTCMQDANNILDVIV